MGDWLTVEAWKSAIERGERTTAGIRKFGAAEPVVREPCPDHDDDDMKRRPTYRFVISTSAVDRHRDTVNVDGWKLTAYRKNPVVLWSHDYRMPPLGQSVVLPRVVDGRLTAGVRFDADVSEMARMVEALVERGTLRATSVGFMPMDHKVNDERRGYDFLSQELLEWSLVPVPANAETLIEARSAGIDVAPLRDWAARVLDEVEGPGTWVKRTELEAAWRQAGAAARFYLLPFGSETTGATGTIGLTITGASTAGITEAAPSAPPAPPPAPPAQPEIALALDEDDDVLDVEDDAGLTADEAREVMAALAEEMAERVLLRLTGRVD